MFVCFGEIRTGTMRVIHITVNIEETQRLPMECIYYGVAPLPLLPYRDV